MTIRFQQLKGAIESTIAYLREADGRPLAINQARALEDALRAAERPVPSRIRRPSASRRAR
mgnify:CR=1 FL=1